MKIENKSALIGYSGFVGSSLLRQHGFKNIYRSTNISEIQNKSFDTVVCCGVSAVKWWANKNPQDDKRSIQSLIDNLKTIKCNKFILISTVDVFANPNGVYESTPINASDLEPYGLNRYQLEEYVKTKFPNSLIVRLPGLVGPGLKKNVIYDLLNNNNLDAVDSRSVFQFYPIVNLWSDIKIAIMNDCKLLHLTSFPISVQEIAFQCFNMDFNNRSQTIPHEYDFRSELTNLYIKNERDYQYSKREILLSIRDYFQYYSSLGV
jgi:dTDP-4-dehydrorhamnose reductase